MTTWRRFHQLTADRRPIAVALAGAGYVGSGVAHRLEHTAGMRVALIVNRSTGHAVEAYRRAGWPADRVVVSDDPAVLSAAIEAGTPAVTARAAALTEVTGITVAVEATGALDHGAALIDACLRAGIDVVSFNAEVDATIGWLLHRVAHEHRAVYTIADGDQPGVLLRHIDHVRGMGFEIVAAVNCKRNLAVHQTPDDSATFAARDKTSMLMTTAFGDGTKMQVENAVVANLTGLRPGVRGMHGIVTTLQDAAGDIVARLGRTGAVDYTLGGDFGAGVGVVGRPPEPHAVATSLRFLKMGDGPDYFFFRPYHLVQFEVPLTIAELVLDRMGVAHPVTAPVAEVVAVAKRDLEPGDRLDGIGGFDCYGLVDTVERAEGLLPIGLSGHARMTRSLPRDEPIPMEAVELDEDAPIVALRRRQEALVADLPTSPATAAKAEHAQR